MSTPNGSDGLGAWMLTSLPAAALSLLVMLTPYRAEAQELTYSLEVLLTIGDDESRGPEYLFRRPKHIVTDSLGRIYVADQNSNRIRVFSDTGDYLTTIGNGGKGPGEMTEIFSMGLNGAGDLVVFDRMNHRTTVFRDLGASFTTYKFPELSLTTATYVGELIPGQVTYYFARRQDGSYQTSDMIHLYDDQYSEKMFAFGRASDLWNMSDPFYEARTGSNGAANVLGVGVTAEIDEALIYVAPVFYEGKVVKYTFSSDGAYRRDELRNGLENPKPYRSFDYDPKDRSNMPPYAMVVNGPTGRYAVERLSASLGIFKTGEGRIIVPLVDFEKGKFFIEEFSSDGKYAGRFPLHLDETIFSGTLWTFSPKWKDEEDRFYISHWNSSDIPVVTVARLVRNVEDEQ